MHGTICCSASLSISDVGSLEHLHSGSSNSVRTSIGDRNMSHMDEGAQDRAFPDTSVERGLIADQSLLLPEGLRASVTRVGKVNVTESRRRPGLPESSPSSFQEGSTARQTLFIRALLILPCLQCPCMS